MSLGDARTSTLVLAIACAATTVACYSPAIDGCNIRCAADMNCPGGMICAAGLCRSTTNDTCGPPPGRIAAGSQHACVIDAHERLFCWGRNDYGQVLPTAPGPPQPVPVEVVHPGVTRWLAVTGGRYHTCAIASDDAGKAKAYCWGNNDSEQCGTNGSTRAPVTPINLTNPVEVTAGRSHTCARTADGRISCWGDNSYGQFGDTVESVTTDETPHEVFGPPGWTKVDAGGDVTCAGRDDGTAWCWGRNESGQVGHGTVSGTQNSGGEFQPRQLAGVTIDAQHPLIAISAGIELACAVHDDGAPILRCWGDNTSGETGTPPPGGDNNVTAPNTVGGINAQRIWKSVAAGTGFACGLTDEGTIHCWGYEDARLGDGCDNCRTTGEGPMEEVVGASEPATAIAVGEAFGCALFGGGTVRCWGSNSHGQRGNGRVMRLPHATKIAMAGPWEAVRLGRDFGCAIKTGATTPTNEVWCWGDNAHKQVALTNNAFEVTPIQVSEATGAFDIALGDNHACALVATTGRFAVKCWGSNANQELGTMMLARDRETPDLGVTGENWGSIHASEDVTCVASSDGTLTLCWGYSGMTSGMLPWLALTTPRSVAQNYPPLRLGPGSACGVSVSSLVCWGRDDRGERGDTAAINSPTLVTGVTPMGGGSLTVGGHSDSFGPHRCAYTATQNTYCWGENGGHQAGPGASMLVNATLLPGPFRTHHATLKQERSIAAGGSFSCAIEDVTRAIHCWGENDYQQCTFAGEGNNGTPTKISGMPSSYKTLTAGESTACAIADDNDVYCWGNCERGQCATGDADTDSLGDVMFPGP